MKIRSLHILKKFPKLRENQSEADLVNMSSPTVIQNRSNTSLREISIEASPPETEEAAKACTP
jgi:hypothetical protein